MWIKMSLKMLSVQVKYHANEYFMPTLCQSFIPNFMPELTLICANEGSARCIKILPFYVTNTNSVTLTFSNSGLYPNKSLWANFLFIRHHSSKTGEHNSYWLKWTQCLKWNLNHWTCLRLVLLNKRTYPLFCKKHGFVPSKDICYQKAPQQISFVSCANIFAVWINNEKG